MIWTTDSSWSCFHWLYRASPSWLQRINLISVLTIWWCPCVEFSLVLLEEDVCYDQWVLLKNSISLCPASFHIPRPNLPVTPGISWLPTFAFQSPIMKRTSFLGLVLKGLVGLHRTFNFSFFSITSRGIDLDYCDIEWFALETNRDHSVIYDIASKYCISDSFVDHRWHKIKPREKEKSMFHVNRHSYP